MDIGIPVFLVIETFLTVKFSASSCQSAVTVNKDCPNGVCKGGNCTVVRDKYLCGCYNIGSGEVCDPLTDGRACDVLQCENGLCKIGQDNAFFCDCIAGWESRKCNKQIPNYRNSASSSRREISQPCPLGSVLCPTGECRKKQVNNCIKDCPNEEDDTCSGMGSGIHPEDARSQWPAFEKDVNSRGQVRDYTGIAVMIGIIGFLSIFFFVFTKLLRSSQREHFLIGAGLRNYLGGLHASQLQDEENVNRGRALRAAQVTNRYAGDLPGCTCPLSSGPRCSCPSSRRLTLEASIHLMHICVEDSISNLSENSHNINLDPPPVYADIVSERVAFTNRRSETPPPAYEDLIFG